MVPVGGDDPVLRPAGSDQPGTDGFLSDGKMDYLRGKLALL
jgi:hypothetical protein